MDVPDWSGLEFHLGDQTGTFVSVTNNPAGGVDISYMVTLKKGVQYTVCETNFTWGALAGSGRGDYGDEWQQSAYYDHTLSFTGFHNQGPVGLQIVYPHIVPDAKKVTEELVKSLE